MNCSIRRAIVVKAVNDKNVELYFHVVYKVNYLYDEDLVNWELNFKSHL